MSSRLVAGSSELPEKTEVVVIGGGAIGAMVTLHLALAGVEVICVEANSKNFGSSSRSAAAARQQFGMAENIAMQLYSIDFFRRYAETLDGRTPPMKHVGYHFMYDGYVKDGSGSQKFLPDMVIGAIGKRVSFQQERGLRDVVLLLPEDIRARFPYIDTTNVACSTFCPSDGFCFPDVITNDGFEKAEKHGARLFQHTRVTGFKRKANGQITHVVTNKGEIECREVVNATGMWSPEIAKLVGTQLPVSAVRRYLYFMKPNLGGKNYNSFAEENNLPLPMDEMPFTIVPGGAYARPDHDLFMLGWDAKPKEDVVSTLPDIANESESQLFQDLIEEGFGLRDDPTYGDEMCEKLSSTLPFLLSSCGFARATTGFYELTADHSPIIDRDPNAENLIHCCGFSGHGIMQSPSAGRVVSEIISNGEPRLVPANTYSLQGLYFRLRGEADKARPHEVMVI